MGEVNLGVVELLDRDGHWRAAHTVAHWPLRIRPRGRQRRGAARPARGSAPRRRAARRTSARTAGRRQPQRRAGRRRTLAAAARLPLAEQGEPVELLLGRSRLRLRLPGHALATEQPLGPVAPDGLRGFAPLALGMLALLAAQAFVSWLDSDPDTFAGALGGTLLATIAGAALWCGLWSLLSKTFTRQTRFGWHLRVAVFGSLALLGTVVLTHLLAFALSWHRLSDFGFVASSAVAIAVLYFHLLAVEPARPRRLRQVAIVAGCAVIGLQLWFNQQRDDRFGAELYMSHLFPPAWRIARPVPVNTLVDGLGALQAVVDRQAKEPAHGDDD